MGLVGGERFGGVAETEVGEGLALPALSPKMVRNIHNMLRKALADACRKGTLQRNVATLADSPKPVRDTAMRVWTPEQLVQFLDEIAEHRLATAFVVAAHTGMRRGEVLGLT